uniref:Alyteserin-2c n=1 Tax=Alytes obstetricans TaxID=8443 RepID=ATI2C_ALYOB|nr:RecName: Full=Alyteserin-2c [Alytes obstetricans]
ILGAILPLVSGLLSSKL